MAEDAVEVQEILTVKPQSGLWSLTEDLIMDSLCVLCHDLRNLKTNPVLNTCVAGFPMPQYTNPARVSVYSPVS